MLGRLVFLQDPYLRFSVYWTSLHFSACCVWKQFFSYFNFSICEFRDLKVYFFLFILWQYHGSFSLRHWLQQSDWLPTLEATLALDEESVRRVGDDTVGGPAVSRQLRITRILMRDLLIGVCIS